MAVKIPVIWDGNEHLPIQVPDTIDSQYLPAGYIDVAGNLIPAGGTVVAPSDIKKCGGATVDLATEELITCPDVVAVVTPASSFDTLSITTPAGGAQILTVPHYADLAGNQLTGGEQLVQAGDLKKCDNTPFNYAVDRVQTCLENATLADMLARTDNAKIVNPNDVHDTLETGQDYFLDLRGDSATGNPYTGAPGRAYFAENDARVAPMRCDVYGTGAANAFNAFNFSTGAGSGGVAVRAGSGPNHGMLGIRVGTGNGSGVFGQNDSTNGDGTRGWVSGPSDGASIFGGIGDVPTATGSGSAVHGVALDWYGTHANAIQGTVNNAVTQWSGNFNANVFVAGTLITSDVALKRKIEPIDTQDAAQRIAALAPTSYEKRIDLSDVKAMRERLEAERLTRLTTSQQRLEAVKKKDKGKGRDDNALQVEVALLEQAIARDTTPLPLVDDDKAWSGKRESGFIAQDFAKVYPDAVRETPSGFLAIDQSAVIADLVATVQYLTKEIAALRASQVGAAVKPVVKK